MVHLIGTYSTCYMSYFLQKLMILLFDFSVGKAKAKVVNDSRAAIKQNNVSLLLKVVRNGDAG